MERGKKNRVKNKFNMKSPFSQVGGTYNPGNLETKGESGEGIYEDASNNVYDPSNTDAGLNWEGKLTRSEYDRFKKMTSGNTPPSESTDPVEPVKEKGIDRWIDKPIMEVLGLTKKQREARKERKAQKIADAKKAEGEGTETLKQAKLVKRAKKREDRALKRKIKDQEKLKKFREKNPVTGKEAINLVTDGGNRSLV